MKIFKFGLFGILNSLLSYMVFSFLIYIGAYYLLASLLSFILGTISSYYLNSTYTFHTTVGNSKLVKFSISMTLSLVLGLLLLYFFVDALSVPILLAQIYVIIIRFPVNYLLAENTI
ncbi:GtrA family protein [Vibrio breoganii]|uniref:GtrA family protein n=1 Tax=Vibrio breoganii TaxID=553239 RepID=UPI0021C46F45|nr:GtrA family protein [Vibrio breoganii]MDN3717482.1 GtrA family protein [Vibrio breoganii]